MNRHKITTSIITVHALLLFFVSASVIVASQAEAATWSARCDYKEFVVKGTHMGDEHIFNLNPTTVSTPQATGPVLMQLGFKNFSFYPSYSATFTSNTGQSKSITSASTDQYIGMYETYMNPASSFTGLYDGQAFRNRTYNQARGLIAYYATPSSIRHSYVGKTFARFDYCSKSEAQCKSTNPGVSETLFLPDKLVEGQDLDVDVVFVDNEPGRKVEVVASVPGKPAITQTFNNSTSGPELTITRLELKNLPAGTDRITVTIRSLGESLGFVGLNTNYTCQQDLLTPTLGAPTATLVPTASITPNPSASATPSPSPSPFPTLTATPNPTATPLPTSTPIPTPTSVPVVGDWFQGYNGGMYSKDDIVSYIPQTVPGDKKYLIIADSMASNDVVVGSNITTGFGGVSSNHWTSEPDADFIPPNVQFDDLKTLLISEADNENYNGQAPSASMDTNGDGIVILYANGDLSLSNAGGGSWLNVNYPLIILANGDITFNASMGDASGPVKNSLGSNGFAMFVAKDNILVDRQIQVPDSTCCNILPENGYVDPKTIPANLEGLFIAGKGVDLSYNGVGGRLQVNGSVILGVDPACKTNPSICAFESDRKVTYSFAYPSEMFVYNPKLTLNIPSFISTPKYSWQEVQN